MANEEGPYPPSSASDRRFKLKTSFTTQANALLRKNITFQKRNWCTNCCLVSMPIVICILLYLLQQIINRLLDGNDFKCGCVNGQCGVQFSNSKQFAFCAIEHPTEWPAFQQIGKPEYRAVKTSPTNFSGLPPESCRESSAECPISVLYTGTNRTLADAVAGYLFSSSADMSSLSRSSIIPATATYPPITWQVEPAFSSFGERANEVYFLVDNCTGIERVDVSLQVIPGYNTSASLKCVEALNLWRDSDVAINDELYAGYYKSDVYPTRQINEISSAYDFGESSVNKFDVSIYYNYTYANETSFGPPPSAVRFARAMNLVSSAFVNFLTGGTKGAYIQFVKDFPKPGTRLSLDFSSLLGPLFFMWILQLLLPIITTSVVYEKQQNLRTMMKMHGLGDRAYWVITYFYFFVVSLIYILFFIIFGSVIGLQFFRLNNIGIQFIFYFVFINSQIAFAFLLSTLFGDVKTATVSGYLYVFGTGLLGAYLYQFFLEDTTFSRGAIFAMELIPAFALYRGLYEFSTYAFQGDYLGESGMQFSDLSDKDNGLLAALGILLVQWALFLPLAYYLDQVVSSSSGVRRHPLFFLHGWLLKRPHPPHSHSPTEEGKKPRDDVEREIALVDSLNGQPGQYSIVCDRLCKVYPPRDGNAAKVAVQNMSVAIPRGECFGMLGPNGAGKTTSLNMMIGFLTPSSGNAVIEGLSILEDMDSIYSIMGVCPQHDLLWEQLTGREHLLFYGRLKNLKGEELLNAVDASLKSVNLFNVANKKSGQYSGGMKRRLSVAISLIGNPLVVYMDEPSTGLDPASRMNLWNVVKTAKQDRAIILTTHSMEEAEVLCDRLGIFVDGEFQCIGNPKELTARYGGTFVFTITTPVQEEAQVLELVKSLAPNSRQVYGLAGTQKFELPVDEVDIADVFAAVERAKSYLSIQAWGVSNTTLEDVFIKVAKGSSSTSFREI